MTKDNQKPDEKAKQREEMKGEGLSKRKRSIAVGSRGKLKFLGGRGSGFTNY